jgi:hypothetical protein
MPAIRVTATLNVTGGTPPISVSLRFITRDPNGVTVDSGSYSDTISTVPATRQYQYTTKDLSSVITPPSTTFTVQAFAALSNAAGSTTVQSSPASATLSPPAAPPQGTLSITVETI